MPITIACPKCRRPLKVDDRQAGQSVRCPGCQTGVKVPQPAADSGNPFAFAATAPPPILDEADSGPANDPAAAELWDSHRRGLRLAWIGTVMFTGVPVAFLVLALASNMVFGSIRLTEALFTSFDEAGPTPQPGGFAVLLLQGAGLFLTAILVLGPLFRILGFVHCICLPRGAPGRTWAIVMLCCELLTLASFGLLFGSRYLPGDMNARLPIFDYLPLVGQLALVGGMIFLLLHLRAVGAALQSKPLLGRVRNFSIWFGGFAGILFILGLTSQLARGRGLTDLVFGLGALSDLLTCSGILVLLFAPIALLLKYMNLLDLAWDEVRKRGGRWRPATI